MQQNRGILRGLAQFWRKDMGLNGRTIVTPTPAPSGKCRVGRAGTDELQKVFNSFEKDRLRHPLGTKRTRKGSFWTPVGRGWDGVLRAELTRVSARNRRSISRLRTSARIGGGVLTSFFSAPLGPVAQTFLSVFPIRTRGGVGHANVATLISGVVCQSKRQGRAAATKS